MLHSKFGNEYRPSPKKSSFRVIFVFALLAALAYGSYWGYKNYQRFVFYFKKDKYATILQYLTAIEKKVKENPASAAEDEAATEELLLRLIQDNPADAYLYFLAGKLYTIECFDPVIKDGNLLTDIFFRDYIDRNHMLSFISRTKWEKGISYTRKALLLGLPEQEVDKATKNLLGLYLLGGTPYWESAASEIKTDPASNDDIVQNLYRLVFTENVPNWELFKKNYGEDTTTFWMSMYFLKIKNYPIAFFYLKKLLLSESVFIRDDAYYLMGYIMGLQKNMPLKLYYHSMIEYEEFLKRNPWFLEEHNYTLRFMGEQVQAKNFLSQYEKMVLELKESNETH